MCFINICIYKYLSKTIVFFAATVGPSDKLLLWMQMSVMFTCDCHIFMFCSLIHLFSHFCLGPRRKCFNTLLIKSATDMINRLQAWKKIHQSFESVFRLFMFEPNVTHFLCYWENKWWDIWFWFADKRNVFRTPDLNSGKLFIWINYLWNKEEIVEIIVSSIPCGCFDFVLSFI